MSEYVIMTILVNHRKQDAQSVQHLLTEYGCNIKMRLGLHETKDTCADEGLILLQLEGDDKDILALNDKLNALDGVKAKRITIASDQE